MSRHRYLSVMGTMGVGKTTAASVLARACKYTLIEEHFDDNAFLPRFYDDMHRWAFHSQTFFLTEKVRQMFDVEGYLHEHSVVQDTPITQDVYSYAQAHHRLGNMDAAEWKLYCKIYESFQDFLPKPDLIIALTAPLDVIHQRIIGRGRSYEQDISLDYIRLLHELNDAWIKRNTQIPLLRVDTTTWNLVKSTADQQAFVDLVRKKLTAL